MSVLSGIFEELRRHILLSGQDITHLWSNGLFTMQITVVAIGLVENVEEQLVYMIEKLTKHECCFDL